MNRPFTFINVAMTADGKIDTVERNGAPISSQKDKQRVDELRAASDAVLVGGGTLLKELPKLTVKNEALREARIQRGLSPNPIKVGIASRADIPTDSAFINAGPARKVIFTTNQTSKPQLDALAANGVEIFVHSGAHVDLPQMSQTLKRIGVDHLMIEGGGTLNFEMLRLGLVDEVHAYIAPLIFGGASAPTLADGIGLDREHAVSLQPFHIEQHEDGGIVIQYRVRS